MSENSLYNTALNKAMSLCSGREYCIEDIAAKLQSWNVTKTASEKIIASLLKENFINEQRYAEAFTRDKFRYNKWGKVKISAHLRAKKISGEIIRSALDKIDNELYRTFIKDLLISHRRKVKAKNQYDLKGKLLRFGLSKGFESEILYDLLNDLED
jgi:regulatory protein